MIIKTISSVIFFFFLLTLSSTVSSSSRSKRVRCENNYGLIPHAEDCNLYIVCMSNGENSERKCPSSTFFQSSIRLCLPRMFFTSARWKYCEEQQTENDGEDVNVKLPAKEGEVEWRNDGETPKNVGRNNSLPSVIIMKLPTKNLPARLTLRKQPQVTDNIQVVLNERGRSESWKSPADEEWDVYSDKDMKASMSVATNKGNKKKKILYDGTFEMNNTKFRLRPLHKKLMYPVDPETTTRVVLNGASYLLTEEKPVKNQYDGLKGRGEKAVLKESATSVMTDLERLINNQVQAQTGQVNYGLELFIVLDYSIFYKWYVRSTETSEQAKKIDAITNIRYFYTHIVAGINERYSSINEPDMTFYVKLVGYYIAQTPGDAPFTEKRGIKLSIDSAEPYRALDEFEKWVVKQTESPVNPLPKFDSIALFTDYKMVVLPDNYAITGLANIGATCYLRAVSINKDQLQYATIETGTHEIGHNLGAFHDGQNNQCSGTQQNIMASAPGGLDENTFFNPYKFSSCSIQYFRKYIAGLDRANNNCLKNAAIDADPSSTAFFLQKHPGQKYSVDTQCKLLFGSSSYYCAGGGERDYKICRELMCYNSEHQECTGKVEQRALDGTSCGNKKWCMRSTCSYDEKATSTAENSCIYGDYKDAFEVNNRRNTCKNHIRENPELCYQKHYRDLCCSTCSTIEDKTDVGCEYGDRRRSCNSIEDSHCYGSFNQTSCCATCKERQEKHSVVDCRYGDKVSWCRNYNSQNAHQCYRSDEWCCETCAQLETGIEGCKYGDRVVGCTLAHCSSAGHKSDCCYTCRSYAPAPVTTTPAPIFPVQCPQGDIVNWCGTLYSGDCYNNKQHCCQTCLQHYDASKPGCEYGDQASWCSSYVKSAEECRLDQVAAQCCQSCKAHLTPNSNPPACPTGEQGEFCKTLKPYECYHYKSSCCQTCPNYFEPESKHCEYGDKVDWCQSYVTGQTECDRPEVAELCCKTCGNIKETFIETDGLIDLADWCSTIFSGYCYQPETLKVCPLSCENHRKNRTEACRYGNFYNWCDPKYCAINKAECCESCP